jgi:hypothetical protein
MRRLSVRNFAKGLAFVVALVLGIGLLLEAMLRDETAVYAFVFGATAVFYFALQLRDHYAWRDRLIKSVLHVDSDRLEQWGVDNAAIDALLLDPDQRAKYEAVLAEYLSDLTKHTHKPDFSDR